MIVRRVEKHTLKQNNEYYSLIDDFCLKAKNLYNHANYIIRQEFCSSNKWIRYSDLDSMLKKIKIIQIIQICQQHSRHNRHFVF